MFESLKTLWKKRINPRRIMIEQSRQLAGKLPGWKANYRATRQWRNAESIDADV
jgi:hypothetical protein